MGEYVSGCFLTGAHVFMYLQSLMCLPGDLRADKKWKSYCTNVYFIVMWLIVGTTNLITHLLTQGTPSCLNLNQITKVSMHLKNEFSLYQTAREFRRGAYRLIRQLPKEETFCLSSQMRRAAISVTNNIAEGHGRWNCRENTRFCHFSRGSTEELLDDFLICLDEKYAHRQQVALLQEDAHQLIAKINSYIAYLRRSRQGKTTE